MGPSGTPLMTNSCVLPFLFVASAVTDLIKLFRPNRDGSLSMIDFVKSTDSVYREIRLLRAAVNNSSKVRCESWICDISGSANQRSQTSITLCCS
jgi:hypothetical protein